METVLLQNIQKQKMILQRPPSTITTTGLEQSITSFAQQRVWFEKNLQNDYSTSLTSNNVVLPLVIKRGSVSIEHIHSSIVTILEQHAVLRTAVYFDKKRDKLIQKVQPRVDIDSYSFQMTRKSVLSVDQIDDLLKNESINNFANLDLGFVLRCHIIKIGLDEDNEYLKPDDLIIFVFHRIVFDYNSIGPFIIAFTQAYDQTKSNIMNLQYIDFTLYENAQLTSGSQNSKINKAQQFWSKSMHGYTPYETYLLPINFTHKMKNRSGHGHSAAFDLQLNVVEAQIEFASLYNVSMSDLGLACFFIFLYELNNGAITDLCVVCPTDNRPLIEMKSMIGMFINVLPYRIEIEQNQSFISFVQRVHQLCVDVREHAQLPYQLIMKDINNSHPPKLPFHFRYDSVDTFTAVGITLESKTKDGTLGLYADQVWLHGNGIVSNDLTLTMIHNHDERKTHYIFECSIDCYHERAAFEMGRQFRNLLSHLFTNSSTATRFNQTHQSIANLSLLLADVKQLSKVVFQQQPPITNTSFPISSNFKIEERFSLIPNEEIINITSNNELENTVANIWYELIHTERFSSDTNILRFNMNAPTQDFSELNASTSVKLSRKEETHANSYKTQQNDDLPISTTTSFFSLGGDSLPLLQLYRHYQSIFNFDAEKLPVRTFFEHDTIAEHAKLLETIITTSIQSRHWHTLNINQGDASFAQARIFLDEQVRFTNKTAVYNELMVLQPVEDSLSIDRLLRALLFVMGKHQVLRTSLVFNNNDNILRQCITNRHQTFTLANEQTFESCKELDDITYQTAINPNLFDLSAGRVFYCQILRHQQLPHENNNKEFIEDSDVFVVGFHHTVYDGSSFDIFLKDLCFAYNNNKIWSDDDEIFQYIDYSVHERLIDMTTSREFWYSQLNGHDFERSLPLPFDRHHSSTDQRSGKASTAQISFDNGISASFLSYASSHQITPFQLGLATFYTFLFTLTHGQTDLCISCLNANRYRSELQDMIGMFVSTLPHRIQLDSRGSFDELVKHVRDKCLSILEHSHYPLQHILSDHCVNRSNAYFLETAFDFITVSSNINQLSFAGTNLEHVLPQHSSKVAKFDFMLTFIYNPTAENNKLSCSFVCSSDRFEKATVALIAERFQYLFEQVFQEKSGVILMDQSIISIDKLSLILPKEKEELNSVVFDRQSNTGNEAPASYAQARVWLDERTRFHRKKTPVALYNMPFLYRLAHLHTLSVKQLHQALQLCVARHQSLRTSLIFDTEKDALMQYVIDLNDDEYRLFAFTESTYETDEQLNCIIYDEKRNSQHFDLSRGLVFRCHLVYYKQISSNDLLPDKDILIFNFHHALFDVPSMDVFLHDLNQAYTTGQLLSSADTALNYLDCKQKHFSSLHIISLSDSDAVIERKMPMTGASMFWHDALYDYKFDRSLPLPFDRYRLAVESRTACRISVTYDFGEHIAHHVLAYASSNDIALIDVALAFYYVFLFKLTNGEKDLCIGMSTHNRYKEELMPLIGMFVNTIPLRCQFDPYRTFHQLTEHTREIITSSMKYSYFPLLRILDQHNNVSKHTFLDTSFAFHSIENKNNKKDVMIGDFRVHAMSPTSIKISPDEIMSHCDFSFTMEHDRNSNQLSYSIDASLDLFNPDTVHKMAQRFHAILEQTFLFTNDQLIKPVYELSLILPDERILMKSMNNTQISVPSVTCLHYAFICQEIKYSQKLAVELDEQSLTYSELLYYVQRLSLHLLINYRITSGEIVCQCVERSLSMVIGMIAIEMSGSVYCPLSPRDPQRRLHARLEQIESRLVLVHFLTRTKFYNNIVLFDIDLVLAGNYVESDIDVRRLSSVVVTPDDIAYIIFTSGSTGIPKAAQIRHRNFTACIDSLVHINTFNGHSTVIQMARCSFDIHVQEIFGALMIGASLVMLRPRCVIDFEYIYKILDNKQITYMHAVPSLLHSLFTFIEQCDNGYRLKHLRSLCSSGEPFTVKLLDLIRNVGVKNCCIWNLYGPAEMTIASTFHPVDVIIDRESIPIGVALPDYRYVILDEFAQPVVVGQEAELVAGGAGAFVGYLGRDDLTNKAFIEMDGELFYQTGDLVRMDNNGLLHYRGRKDHQIKLHGQRIELGEIERCLFNTSISACIIIKWDDDHLVAYVQSSTIDEKELRKHCQLHLPPHMIPSKFIVLDKLPLNTNGKVDRKLLPSPDFSQLLSTHLRNNNQLLVPRNEIEVTMHDIWCDIFHQSQISMDTNLFTIGGHSLLLVQLFHRYRIDFQLLPNTLSIAAFFHNPTIAGHVQLIDQIKGMEQHTTDRSWSPLYLNRVRASFAQERIILDEQIRFSSKYNNNMYVIPLLYRLSSSSDHLSITRLHHAFQLVITKQNILRTAFYLDTSGIIMQHCLDKSTTIDGIKSDNFSILNLRYNDDHNIDETINKLVTHSDLFDLSKGRVICCHILRQYCPRDGLSFQDDDRLTKDDLILFCIHHSVFDGESISIFLHDFSVAYDDQCALAIDDNALQYADYSVHERLIDMTTSREFWYSQLNGHDFERSLPLPFDRHHSSTDQRSGKASTAQISFDNGISASFLSYASSHQITPFQLGLATFYTFLFKLTHGQTDLCISCLNANRYRSELQDMIGMFVSTLPHRIQLDSRGSFDELVKHVRDKCLSILEHSHYPLQHIFHDFDLNQSNISFLETIFDFNLVSSNANHLSLIDASLEELSMEQSYDVAKFDFMLTFIYNPTSDDDQLSCHFVCSRDVFDKTTVETMARRFKHLVNQLFSSNSAANRFDIFLMPIIKLDIILPEETDDIKSVVFCRQSNLINEAPASYAQSRIWLDERIRFQPEKSHVAIYNMPFLYCLSPNHTLSTKQLYHALQLIINKHQSLHTALVYDTKTNILMQRIIDSSDSKLFTCIESIFETDEQLNSIMYDERSNSQHFDLTHGIVFRCHIVYHNQVSTNDVLPNKDILIFNFHHALFDIPSMDLFLHDLNQAYTTGQLSTNDGNTLRYLDYSLIEQQIPMTGASMFWIDMLQDCNIDQSLPLPFDRYRLIDEYRTGRGTSVTFDFDQDLSQHFLIHTLLKNITPEHLVLATYYAFLFKLTNGEKDLCIGININGRYSDELKPLIGMFVNAIPLRCQLDPHWSFHQLVEHVCEMVASSMKYSYFPLQCILAQHSNASKPTFLDTSFEFESTRNENSENKIMVDGCRLDAMPMSLKITDDEIMSKFDFILSVEHDSNRNQLAFTINASLDLFHKETVDKFGQRFHAMLKQLFICCDTQMEKSIYELSLILPDERTLMKSINNTKVLLPSASCIHHEFVYQVTKHPEKVALELDDQHLTYAELLYYAQLLTIYLFDNHLLIPGEIVCQCVERSLSMVIGIITILMGGGTYCSLSPHDPKYRLHSLLQQTQSRLVLVDCFTESKFNNDIISLDINSILIQNNAGNDINLDRLSDIMLRLNSIAYIIFTSGSTGTPKAIQIRHKNFIKSVHSLTHIDLFNYKDIIVQMSGCLYDAHMLETIGILITGSSIVMLRPEGNMDMDYLFKTLREKQVSYMQCVPAYLNNIVDFLSNHNCLGHNTLRTIDVGGDISTVSLIKKVYNYFSKEIRIWNFYGPAETTIACTCHRVDISNDIESIPIGLPLSNYKCEIFDQLLQRVFIDQEGELFVGGIGVFAGYLGRDDLTQKVVCKINGELYYRTGDLVRMDNNGLLHYRGRTDHQIKLHGQRIELGEIERCLLNLPISACVVIKWSDDHLVAYVQSSNIINGKQLRKHCQSHLPSHMIPSTFIVLEQLPLNANGKVDRKQLPPPNFASSSLSNSEDQHFELNDVIETQIHSLWCEILQRTHISIITNFFSIGGHSLLLIQLYHRYKMIFNLDTNIINMAQLIEYPTIADHARLIRQSTNCAQRDAASWFLLHFGPENSTTHQLSFSSEIRLYIRRKNIDGLPQDVTINTDQLEQIYLSSIIQEIYIIHITDPRCNGYTSSRQQLAAIIISQALETIVLEDLETISKLKQLDDSQIPWIVLIERESLHAAEGSQLIPLKNMDREILENQYRTKIINIILAHENIKGDTVDFFSIGIHQQKMIQSRLLIENDKILEPALLPPADVNKKTTCTDIFLTGSTGFLGSYLLNELLKRTDANIYCLVRSIPTTNVSPSRVHYLYGDLTLPQLGLDDQQYSMLTLKVRSVYHCGAAINFIKSYSEHRSANVLSTLEIIKLSCLANCRINYISTLSVLDTNTQSGYVQSKQVAECLLEQARKRGLFVTILRTGYLSWSLSTGDFNKTDWITILLLDLIEFGLAPETNLIVRMTPVDQISRSIVELGESEETVNVTTNISPTHAVTFKAIWTEICRQRMVEPHYLDMIEWRRNLDEHFKTNSQSLPRLQLLLDELPILFSEHSTITIGTESDVKLLLFIKKLLRK